MQSLARVVAGWLGCFVVSAQTSVTSVDYAPGTLILAPGQVSEISIQSVREILEAEAPAPWPLTMSGVRITFDPTLDGVVSAGIGWVRKAGGPLAGRHYYTVRFQVPPDMVGERAFGNNTFLTPRTMTTYLGSTEIDSREFLVFVDWVRFRGACESFRYLQRSLWPTYECKAGVVYHQDGSSVTAAAPARQGERLYVLVEGLGRVFPSPPPGKPFESGDLIRHATAGVRFAPGVLPGTSVLYLDRLPSSTTPVVGGIDLYRVDFVAPVLTESTRLGSCLTTLSDSGPVMGSNATLQVVATSSFATAHFCIAPEPPPATAP